jgi:arginine/ornithine N-succinyltransferase beta subunit
MFYIRRAHPEDQDILLKLAKTVHFINLPPDKDLIGERIRRSRMSFRSAVTGEEPQFEQGVQGVHRQSPVFMFVLVDSETGNALGTSSIIAHMGGARKPEYRA